MENIELTTATSQELAAVRSAIGLGNVNDTSDASKPVSTAQLTSINERMPLPWKISGCTGAWDWQDVVLNGNGIGARITQFNDKSGNGNHMTFGTDSTRAVVTASGAQLRGGIYVIANGGIPNLSSQNQTIVYIGREFTTENPNVGLTSTAGTLFSMGSSRPRVAWQQAYCLLNGGTDYYGPAPLWAPAGRPTMLAQVCTATESRYYNNGIQWARAAYTATTNSLTHMFGQPDGFSPMYRPMYFVGVYNRALSASEIASIGAYYGCSDSPSSTAVFAFGSSTPNGVNSGEYRLGCCSLFADAIGASTALWSYGGASWNGAADSMATSGLFVHRGQRNIHVILPQHNDLAGHVPVATCQTAITNHMARVRAADPFAQFLLCPVTPRNSTFTNGQTYDDFDVDRLALNSFMQTLASSEVGVVYIDAMSIDKLGDKGDEADTTYFHTDQLHMNAAGHRAYAQSMFRGFLLLNTGI